MRILYNKSGLVDFEAPIFLSQENKEKFISGMKDIFRSELEICSIIEKDKEMGEIDRHPRKFSPQDYIDLLTSSLENEDVAKKFNKTEFAIQMKRGIILPKFQKFCENHSIKMPSHDNIKKFLEEEGLL